MTLKRRQFLKQAGAVLTALSLPFDRAAVAMPHASERMPLTRRGAPKRIIIVGAGLAGLSAAYELSQAGHDVVVLEARMRPGGRVLTLRDPFAEGMYAEAGASRIPDHHHFTTKYIEMFGLPLEDFRPTNSATVYYARGKRMIVNPGEVVPWPYALTAEERTLDLSGLRRKYIGAMFAQLGDVTSASWPPEGVKQYDAMNRSEFWRSLGASPEVIDLLSWGGFDDRADTVSALFMLRNSALGQAATRYSKIRGGNDQLPRAFANRLGAKIRYGAAVQRVEHDASGVRVFYRDAHSIQSVAGDHVICAVPFTVQKDIEVSPPLSVTKQTAIEELPYRSISKVFLQSKTRFWNAQGLDGFANTDLPIREVWDMTYKQPSVRGILQAYPMSFHSRRLATLPEDERIAFAVDQVEMVYPGIRAQVEGGVSKCWDEDKWARGASAFYKPGQIVSLLPHVARAEGRVHFAGEHTSVWIDGWMQGALESGNRVAAEII